jgi:hypothetical protein
MHPACSMRASTCCAASGWRHGCSAGSATRCGPCPLSWCWPCWALRFRSRPTASRGRPPSSAPIFLCASCRPRAGCRAAWASPCPTPPRCSRQVPPPRTSAPGPGGSSAAWRLTACCRARCWPPSAPGGGAPVRGACGWTRPTRITARCWRGAMRCSRRRWWMPSRHGMRRRSCARPRCPPARARRCLVSSCRPSRHGLLSRQAPTSGCAASPAPAASGRMCLKTCARPGPHAC